MRQSQFNLGDTTGFYNHIQKKKTKPPTDTLLATNKDDWLCAKTTVRSEKKVIRSDRHDLHRLQFTSHVGIVAISADNSVYKH